MKSGFTLIEVMVAVAVASLLIVGVSASAQSTIRTAERQMADARTAEERGRGIELLRADWRGRVKVLKPSRTPPIGTRSFVLIGTGDAICPQGGCRGGTVTYSASEQGFWRMEQGAPLLLLKGPVLPEFWDGLSWTSELPRRTVALRLQFGDPPEIVVLK
jgi:prepilin-type N-terminal cleavage/methylation domain-containing protein